MKLFYSCRSLRALRALLAEKGKFKALLKSYSFPQIRRLSQRSLAKGRALLFLIAKMGGLVFTDERFEPGVRAAEATVREIHFSRDIAPVFKASCNACHGPKEQQGGLWLDSEESLPTGRYLR